MELGLTGLASGFDWGTLVDQLTEVERAPQRRLRSEQSTLDLRKNAYSSIATQLGVLKNRVDVLKDPALFAARKANSSDDALATATAGAGTPLGSYTFNVTQLATATVRQGVANVGSALRPTDDVSGLVLNQAPLALAVTAGTFTVNGKQITIATTDTLQSVFDKISTATGGTVTATYSTATDRLTLSSTSEIVLGSANDTSNFLQAFKLNNNGTGTITSSSALGSIRTTASLSTANFATAISDGGAGAGQFKINGVSIAFKTSDALADVIGRINASGAGVHASYDTVNDRIVLTNQATGDLGMGLEDVTGNFLAATGLASGTLQRGNNLLYSINGGGTLVSHSNTITDSSSAITGLAVSVLALGSTRIDVASDNEKITTAIKDFIEEYNKSQTMIDAQTASSTDADGVVTAGDLAGDTEANEVAKRLRSLVNAVLTGLPGSITQLDSLGIESNGTDDTLKLADSEALENALRDKLDQVRDLFTNTTSGIAAKLQTYLEATVGDDGLLEAKQDTLSNQIADIDTQISDMERVVLSNQERLVRSFVAMEQAQARINQQMQFLLQRLGTASA